MATPTTTKQWLLQNKPSDMPVPGSSPTSTFKLVEKDIPSTLPAGHVLLKTLAFSNDPAQRAWISAVIPADRLYREPIPVGDVMNTRALATVVKSADDSLKEGAFVLASTGWTEYAVFAAKDCQPAAELPNNQPLTHYLGALGLTGWTAYYGLVEVAKATPDDFVVVSGAAGATGSMVVQIAKKLVGCKRVVGMAGTDEKCRWVEGMGADVCLNYKSPTFEEDLIKATEGKADVYFENVGGHILDLMLTRMKTHGRIAFCGSISGYNSENDKKKHAITNMFDVISNRLSLLGFIVTDFLTAPGGNGPKTVQKFVKAVGEGKLKLTEDMETVVSTKFEDVPATWLKLFEGGNTGKLITKLV